MGQKASDLETIPLCDPDHKEQHRVGLKAFVRRHRLDIPALLEALTAKPHIRIWEGRYVATWRKEVLALTLVEYGFTSAMICLRDRVQEILSDEIRARVSAKRSVLLGRPD